MPAHEKDPATDESARSIQAEHDELRVLLERIQGVVFPDLPPLLVQLRDLLVKHFATEEGPGGFEAITESQPQFLPRLAEIFEEHQGFLDRLDAIAGRVESCEKERNALLDAVRALAHELHEHEAKENELLGDVLYTDLGGGA